MRLRTQSYGVHVPALAVLIVLVVIAIVRVVPSMSLAGAAAVIVASVVLIGFGVWLARRGGGWGGWGNSGRMGN